MAPLSRGRASGDGVPTGLNALYYAQRAAAGLIVAESAEVAPGEAGAPGLRIAEAEQARGWRLVTDAVHAAGRIILQLCHTDLPGEPPTALLSGMVAAFTVSARHARDAGFDGVEIHAGPKHLIGRLLHGQKGAYRSRSQALFAALDAVVPVWGPERVGVRLSLDAFSSTYLLDHVASRMQARSLSYLHGILEATAFPASLRAHFRGAIILAGKFDRQGAEAALQGGAADLIAFGMPFVANPDLVDRLRHDVPLARADMVTLRGGGATGYTDYPRAPAIVAAASNSAG